MPYAQNGRVRIYWEEEGSGEPLLLIMGLSFSLAMWGELRPFFARHSRAILLDNRGIGKSDVPVRPFGLATMADDAEAVLDAAGVDSAHVMGISMGGMIAQELAIRSPNRVRSLVLGCTFCGRGHSALPEKAVQKVLTTPLLTRAARLRALVPILYDQGTSPDLIEKDLEVMKRHAPKVVGYVHQVRAIYFWDSYDRLPEIQCPTLVVHGESDQLVPPANARILADRIPGATLALIPSAGHIFPTDQPERTRAVLAQFFESLGMAFSEPGVDHA